MDIQELYLPFGEYRTYCRILRSDSDKEPLILLHGGPGSTHDSFELLDDLAYQDDRTIVFYDQLGCGKSADERIPDDHLCRKTWLEELANLIDRLSFPSFFLLGHSWGGMLLMDYLIEKKDECVKGAIFSSTLSSSRLWEQEARRLVRYLSLEDRKAIKKAIETKRFDSLEFQLATEHYSELFIAPKKDDSLPPCLKTKKNPQGKKAYERAWGPCEFVPLGELKDFDRTNRLKEIACPVLLLSGTNDESTPLINKTMIDNMTCPRKWVLLENARHLSYYDAPENYRQAVLSFLNGEDENGQR